VAADLSRRPELLSRPPDGVVAGPTAEHRGRARGIPGPPTPVQLASLVVLALGAIGVGCSSGAASHAPLSSPGVPRTLADGSRPVSLPPQLRRYRGLPVAGARTLSAHSTALRSCPPDPSLRGRTSLAGAWLSTDGLSVGYYVKGAPPLWACDAARTAGRLRRCAGGASPARTPDRVARAGGSVGICSVSKRVAFMWIASPARAGWALVDHGSFWVAYRTPKSRLLRISGTKGVNPQGSFRIAIAFLEPGGRVFAEEIVRGFVAG